MSVTITGGTGFLGRNIVHSIVAQSNVCVISTDPWPGPKPSNLRTVIGDVRDYGKVFEACKGADCVFHLAAQLPISNLPKETVWAVNVDGTRNVLEASLQGKVRRVVHISSSSVYGIPSQIPCFEDSPHNPIGVYGRSKIMAEQVCMEYAKKGLEVAVLRPMTIVGPGMKGVFLILFDWVRNGKKVYLIGDGSNRIQMISLQDLVAACRLASEKPEISGQIMNVGSDNVPSVKQLIQSLIEHAQSGSKIVPIKAWFASNALKLLRLTGLSPLVAEHYFLASKDFILDNTRAKSLLGWRPSLTNEEMMIQAYDWFVQNQDEIPDQRQGILRLLRLFS